eukprot:1520149-Rhodomonas_salina.2
MPGTDLACGVAPRGLNQHGPGPPSEGAGAEQAVEVTTLCDIPPPPSQPVLVEESPFSLLVSWSAPERDNGSEVIEYCLQRRAGGMAQGNGLDERQGYGARSATSRRARYSRPVLTRGAAVPGGDADAGTRPGARDDLRRAGAGAERGGVERVERREHDGDPAPAPAGPPPVAHLARDAQLRHAVLVSRRACTLPLCRSTLSPSDRSAARRSSDWTDNRGLAD